MHLPTLTLPLLLALALPHLSAAEQQPLGAKAAAWFDKAKSYISSGAADVLPNPIDAGASKVAQQGVQRITVRNWERKLAPKMTGPEDWMILFTGRNQTCMGNCAQVDLAWTEAVPLLLASPNAPKLGHVDCDAENQLCCTLAAAVPTVWYMRFPAIPTLHSGPQSATRTPPETPKTAIYIVPLNFTTTTSADMLAIHTERDTQLTDEVLYKHRLMHPIDGLLRRFGILGYFGQFMYIVGHLPGWAVMLLISFASRTIMTRRINKRTPFIGGAGEMVAGPAVEAARNRKKKN